MSDPLNLEEYNKKTMENLHTEGHGADVVTWFPCPGCAEADWKGFPITAGLDDYETVQGPTMCEHCKRTFRFAINKTSTGIEGRILQLSGPMKPDYLPSVIQFR